ncbi:cyclopropane-fatty-acyl-phospholipid synthase family protein [Paracoccaceae bacterium]|nr:cyclopropane-fatty-acyl-phospholipid synthase family protein [Paracoccaceae bacterium]
MWIRLLDKLLVQLVKKGQLIVEYPNGRIVVYGQNLDKKINVKINNSRILRRLFVNPDLTIGEAYMNGDLGIKNDDIFGFLALITQNLTNQPDSWISKLLLFTNNSFLNSIKANVPSRSKSNVKHHYDLSPELYTLFLDVDKQYSCAYFKNVDDTLEQAQEQKKHHIAKKLSLQPGMSVLDIGSGWGGMAITLAKNYNVNVLGITLSEEQQKISQQRAISEGLEGKVEFKLMDYREDLGVFDRIVSVGMFEHVGVPNYAEYFRTIKNKLSPGGVALVHTIGRITPPGGTSPWIKKYIFPGGYIPALSEMVAAVEKNYLYISDVEVLRMHYAMTLNHWHQRFTENEERIKKIYDERFCRMWRYYLVASEISFRYYQQVVFQVQISKDQMTLPITRDYLLE